MSAPKRPHPPPEAVFQALSASHEQMLVQLTELQALVVGVDESGIDDGLRQRAKALVAFFTTHARAHHAEEEARIFPALLRQGNADTTHLVHRLQQDHGWLEEDWLLLCPQLEALANGHSGSRPRPRAPGRRSVCCALLGAHRVGRRSGLPQAREALGVRKASSGQDERARRAALASA